MNRTFCIHPQDLTTEFLYPVYNAFIEFEDTSGISGDSSEDCFFDDLTNALSNPDIHSFIFLGHGYSSALYGNGFSELITESELRTINNKTLILFACNSSRLMEKINAKMGIGFGFIPSGQDDILHSPKFHDLDLSPMEIIDWDCLRDAYRKSWIRAIKGAKDLSDVYGLYKRLDLFFNRAIVEILSNSNLVNKKLISNILFYVKKDMQYFGT